MSPSEDDLCAIALQILKDLSIKLALNLYGRNPDRARSRELAAEMRRVLDSAEKSLGDEHVEPLRLFVEQEQLKVLRVFGTSGWDEPESRQTSIGEGLRIGMDQALQAPFTDEDLEALERAVTEMVPGQVVVTLPGDLARRLAAELRRVRHMARAAIDTSMHSGHEHFLRALLGETCDDQECSWRDKEWHR